MTSGQGDNSNVSGKIGYMSLSMIFKVNLSYVYADVKGARLWPQARVGERAAREPMIGGKIIINPNSYPKYTWRYHLFVQEMEIMVYHMSK